MYSSELLRRRTDIGIYLIKLELKREQKAALNAVGSNTIAALSNFYQLVLLRILWLTVQKKSGFDSCILVDSSLHKLNFKPERPVNEKNLILYLRKKD